MTKEIEKLRRQSDNIHMRREMHAKGGAEIDENTEEKKAEAITDHLVGEGCTVIHAHPERI